MMNHFYNLIQSQHFTLKFNNNKKIEIISNTSFIKTHLRLKKFVTFIPGLFLNMSCHTC